MEKKIVILLISSLMIFWHWFEPVSKKNAEGIIAYKKGEYNKALEKFLSAKGLRPDSEKLKNNTALALYNLGKFDKALEEFSKMDPKKLGIKASDFYYNLGNSFFRLKKYNKALENYKKSLKLNPEDINAKKNFEITLKKIKENKNKQNKKRDKNKKKQDKKDQNSEKKEQRSPDRKRKNYKTILKYLNRKEMEQMKKKKRKTSKNKNEKDW